MGFMMISDELLRWAGRQRVRGSRSLARGLWASDLEGSQASPRAYTAVAGHGLPLSASRSRRAITAGNPRRR
jgi:hypothetical protein